MRCAAGGCSGNLRFAMWTLQNAFNYAAAFSRIVHPILRFLIMTIQRKNVINYTHQTVQSTHVRYIIYIKSITDNRINFVTMTY